MAVLRAMPSPWLQYPGLSFIFQPVLLYLSPAGRAGDVVAGREKKQRHCDRQKEFMIFVISVVVVVVVTIDYTRKLEFITYTR